MADNHIFPSFLGQSADVVARLLLGCVLERIIDGETIRVKIVETESYDQDDAASHSYKGRTPRTDVMFGPSGFLYVYFTYGMHYCCNVVCGPKGRGEAVLIRAVEPLFGLSTIEHRRHKKGVEATNGPAKLCQALGIDSALNGHDLRCSPLRLHLGTEAKSEDVVIAKRIGITKAVDEPRRFYIRNNPYVS